MYKTLFIRHYIYAVSLLLPILIMSSTVAFSQKIYHVGPGQVLSKLSQVPWNTLGPGDQVNIHYDPNPYREKFVISTSGEKGNPITVIGINGPKGEKPIIDGEDATTDPSKLCASNIDKYGLIFIAPGTDVNGKCLNGASYAPIPHDIVIDNLEIRNAHPDKKYTAVGQSAVFYDVFSAGIYAERVQDLVIRNCNFNHCAIGLFINSKFLMHALSKNILIEKNIFTQNGVKDDFHDHGLYVEAENVIYQYNFFDKLRDDALGATIKDRSAGNIFRYNWINSSKGHSIQIAEPQGGIGILDLLPSYKETFIYGNVFFSDIEGAVRHIRYGGDQGDYKYYRQGTLYFYNNTFIVERNKTLGPKNQYDISLFFMPDGGEIKGADTVTLKTKIDSRNNIIYIQPTPGSPAGTVPSLLSILSTNLSGEVTMTNNWLSPGIADIYLFNNPNGSKKTNSGRVTHINTIYGNKGKNDPSFTDYSKGDYSLSANSNAINTGIDLPTAATPYPVLEEYIKHMNSRVRNLLGTVDLGAFESTIPNSELNYPGDLTTTYGAADFNPGDPKNPITPIPQESSVTTVATIVGGKIHIIGAGKTIIKSSVAGKEFLLNLTVNKATLTVHPNPAFKQQGAANPSFTLSYTGFVHGENESILKTKPTAITNATTTSVANAQLTTPPVLANPYPIIASGGSATNYNLVYAEGVLLISVGKLIPIILMQPENAMIYGSADFDIGATSSYSGVPLVYNSSDLKVATLINNKVHIVGIGKIKITVSQAGDNFYGPAKDFISNLEITPAVITVTPHAKSKNLNAPNPPLTFSYSGFVFGEDQSVITKPPTFTTTATLSSPAGAYPIIASGAQANNYTFQYLSQKLLVGQVSANTQLITFPASASLTYGAADFTPNATSNTSNPITFKSSNAAVATLLNGKIHIVSAGSTNITASQAGDVSYPAAIDVVQTLTVAKAPLVITADMQTKAEMSPNPVFTLNYAGFVYAEDSKVLNPQPIVTSTATTNSTAGDYPITVSGAGAANYMINYVNGILTITKVADGKRPPITSAEIGNLISPNGDGFNDIWLIKNIEYYPENNLKIFDRHGRVIFEKHGYKNSWDGKLNGKPLIVDAYFYFLDLGEGYGRIKGAITLIL